MNEAEALQSPAGVIAFPSVDAAGVEHARAIRRSLESSFGSSIARHASRFRLWSEGANALRTPNATVELLP